MRRQTRVIWMLTTLAETASQIYHPIAVDLKKGAQQRWKVIIKVTMTPHRPKIEATTTNSTVVTVGAYLLPLEWAVAKLATMMMRKPGAKKKGPLEKCRALLRAVGVTLKKATRMAKGRCAEA